MASGEEDIDKLKLPAALKLAKERNIPIIGLRDLEEIKWQLKKYLLAERRKRDDVNIFFFILLSLSHTHK